MRAALHAVLERGGNVCAGNGNNPAPSRPPGQQQRAQAQALRIIREYMTVAS